MLSLADCGMLFNLLLKHIDKSFSMFCGKLWHGSGKCGMLYYSKCCKLWQALAKFGRLWLNVADCGGLWQIVANNCRLW